MKKENLNIGFGHHPKKMGLATPEKENGGG
jgi:hypothetical protein